jgi:hypothetical protein
MASTPVLDEIEATYNAYPPTEAMSFPWLTND